MSPGTLRGPRSLDVVFGLFLASGITVGAYSLWAVADWIHPQGEKAFGSLFLGALSFAPTLLAWLAGSVHMFMASRNQDVRLGVALTTAHFLWWFLLVGVALWHHLPSPPQWAMSTMVFSSAHHASASHAAWRASSCQVSSSMNSISGLTARPSPHCARPCAAP